MTIAAAYLTSEGVVLGADSTTTVTGSVVGGRTGVLQLLQHAQKVFEVGEVPGKSRLAVCTWGAGNLGTTSHRTIIARLAESLDLERATVEEAATRLRDMAFPLVRQSGAETLGYFVGGSNPGTHDPACYQLVMGKDSEPIIRPLNIGECNFSGNPEFFGRAFHGYAPRLPILLSKRLKELLGDKADPEFGPIFDQAFKAVAQELVSRYHRDLPIREAIDFVYSFLHLSVKAIKFQFGAPACGGPLEIGFVTTDRRFRWACHKSFTSALDEQEGQRDD